MEFETFDIVGPVRIMPKVFGDDRGYFFESFRQDKFRDAIGKDVTFIQDNQSLSREVGTVRGLHYQAPPFAQAKLMRVLAGAIRDIIVDVRTDSPTYGQTLVVDLDAQDHHQFFVPRGFLHGFVTLQPDTIVAYKVDNVYSADHDGGVRWDSPSLGLDWGVDGERAVLSAKDRSTPLFAEWTSPF